MAGTFDAMSNQQKQLLEQAQSATYRELGEGQQDLNIYFYLPRNFKEGDKRPMMLFFFSSNWDRGNVVQFAPQALYFVERGAVCGLVEYRTSSTHSDFSPLQSVSDGIAAIRFVRLYADQLNVDTSKIIVMGGGAGGNIAGCAALGIKWKDPQAEHTEIDPVPNGAVLLSSLIEVNKRSFAFKQFAERPGDAKKVSLPSLVDSTTKCPMIMIHGTADRMTGIDEAEAFAAKMARKKKKQFAFHAFEGRDSNFYNLNTDPVSFEAALNLIDQFLVDHLLLDMNDNPNGASLVSWREQDF